MNLGCEYKEEFLSKTGKNLVFRDELWLYQTPGQEIAYKIIGYDDNGNKVNKTNQEIFNSYLKWLDKDHPVLKSTYCNDGDKIRQIQGFPALNRSWYQVHVDNCNKFFEKYGIDNVKFYVL